MWSHECMTFDSGILKTICSRKLPNIFLWELRPVVRHDLISKPHAGKQGAQHANDLLSCSVLHRYNRRPLTVCISCPHEHIYLDWSCKIDMRPLLGKSRVLRPTHGCWIICSLSPWHHSQFLPAFYGPCRCLVTKIPPWDTFSILTVPMWPSSFQNPPSQSGWDDNSITSHLNFMMNGRDAHVPNTPQSIPRNVMFLHSSRYHPIAKIALKYPVEPGPWPAAW